MNIAEELDKIKLKGSWNELKGKVLQKYGDLTEDDLSFVKGKEEEMIGKLQQKLGKTKDEILKELRMFAEEI